jgi:hypothetical protein
MRLSTTELYELPKMAMIRFCGHYRRAHKDHRTLRLYPIQKHLVIDYPLIYTYGIYPYWRLR